MKKAFGLFLVGLFASVSITAFALPPGKCMYNCAKVGGTYEQCTRICETN